MVLVRHGSTEWNRVGRYQGHADVELDDEGRRQMAATAAALAGEIGSRSGAGPIIVSSDLRRAAESALIVAAALGAAVIEHPGLREVDLGAWEGLTAEEALVRFPEEYRLWQGGDESRFDVRRGGGETVTEAAKRFADGITEALLTASSAGLWEASESDVIVVAHGLVLQGGLTELTRRGVLSFEGAPPRFGNGQHLTVELREDFALVTTSGDATPLG
jgi:glucosyl-3-phosphoglycerate phosphatase